jgi:hypothetical protein
MEPKRDGTNLFAVGKEKFPGAKHLFSGAIYLGPDGKQFSAVGKEFWPGAKQFAQPAKSNLPIEQLQQPPRLRRQLFRTFTRCAAGTPAPRRLTSALLRRTSALLRLTARAAPVYVRIVPGSVCAA